MKNKKVLYILLTLNIALFFNIKNIFATDITLDAGETSTNANAGTGGSAKTNTPIAYGYRVSFVDPTNGNETVGHSVDYWGQGKMVYENRCAIDGVICKSEIFDWDFISSYSKYPNGNKEITYRYYDVKYNKTQSISGTGTNHTGKYSLKNSYNDFLIPKYRDYLISTTGCKNLSVTKDEPLATLISASLSDSCYNNNYSRFAYESLKKAASSKDFATYAKLIKEAGVVTAGDKTDAEIVSAAKEYIMIVEPLTAIRTNESGYSLSNPIYIGTMYELYKMNAINELGGGWVYDRYSYINAKIYNRQAAGGVAACGDGTSGGKIANLDKGKCSGAFTVIIADLFPCTANVTSLFKSYKDNKITASQYDTSVQKECTDSGIGTCDWLKVGSDKDKPLYEQYGVNPENINSCEMPTCNAVAKLNSSKFTSSTTMRNFLSKLGYKLPSLANVDAYYSNPKLINDNSNLCAATACSSLLNNIKASKSNINAKIDVLNKITGEQYALLNRTVLDETGYEPKCDDVSACKVSPITPSCNSTNSTFTFQDAVKTSENINCDFSKIAYNKTVGDKVLSKSVQTSVDKNYGTNAYCRETVTFNFPTDALKTSGGTIMKWGTNTSKLNDLFGTMTVTRKCYSIGEKNNTGFVINSNWANVIGGPMDTKNNGRINPSIEMNYKEAVSDDSSAMEISKVYMDTSLSRFEMVIHGKNSSTDRAISYYDEVGNFVSNNSVTFKNDANKTKYREFKCGSNCETIDYVEMIADYNITYPDNLKWYSDSKESFKKKNAKDVEDKGVAEARYVALGYGLPTTFLTPSSFDTVYGLSSDKSSGYMFVNLSNVGTKNVDGTYHFDRYTQYYIEDAYKNELDTSKKTIKYSCNFSIENILYDYECPDQECGSKAPVCQEVNGQKICGANRVPNGLDVVFRTVELIADSKDIDVAFPGRSGTGRNIGLNWQLDTENKIATNILHEDIYEQEPKYVIDLTSTVIQNIRKTNNKNSYTSLDDYKFAKNKPTINNTVLTDIGDLCKNGDKDSCRSYSYLYKKNQLYSKDTDSDIDYSYTYAASNFISTYASKGTLKGTCVKEIDTQKRADAFSKTFGC